MKSDLQTLSGITLPQVRSLAESRLLHEPEEYDGDHHLNPDYHDWVVSNAVKDAAVLMPLVARDDEISVVLTKRAEQLSAHSGQVAFPGGKIDDTDASPEAAALREADEEIGLSPGNVEVLGRLPDYYSGSGFRIAPIIAIMDAGASVAANPDEVDYVFEVPLSFLMNPQNHQRGSRVFEGTRRHYLEMPYGDHYIWGVTAGIIRVMYERLFR